MPAVGELELESHVGVVEEGTLEVAFPGIDAPGDPVQAGQVFIPADQGRIDGHFGFPCQLDDALLPVGSTRRQLLRRHLSHELVSLTE